MIYRVIRINCYLFQLCPEPQVVGHGQILNHKPIAMFKYFISYFIVFALRSPTTVVEPLTLLKFYMASAALFLVSKAMGVFMWREFWT